MGTSNLAVLETIQHRHAVRSFADQAVDKATIHALLDAAVRAPTALHEEPWAFVVIQDKAVLKRLSDRARQSLAAEEHKLHGAGREHFTPPENIFYDAGTLIVIYGKPVGRFVVADCWLAAENLMLAACAMGLGTCVIGLAVTALNTPEWKSELEVPDDLTAYAPIIVGVPRVEAPPTSRKEPLILAWKTGSRELGKPA